MVSQREAHTLYLVGLKKERSLTSHPPPGPPCRNTTDNGVAEGKPGRDQDRERAKVADTRTHQGCHPCYRLSRSCPRRSLASRSVRAHIPAILTRECGDRTPSAFQSRRAQWADTWWTEKYRGGKRLLTKDGSSGVSDVEEYSMEIWTCKRQGALWILWWR